MADKPFKQFERKIARLFGGRRFPANQGGTVDVEGPTVIAQCKLIKVLSLNALAEEAERIARRSAGTLKTGVVAVKPRRGRGQRSPILIVLTAEEWTKMHGTPSPVSDGQRSYYARRPAIPSAPGGVRQSRRPVLLREMGVGVDDLLRR